MKTNQIVHADRSTYLGSHDIPAIAGVHPFKTPLQVYMEKLGLSPGQAQTEPMEWGLRIQPAILRKFADAHQVELEPEQFFRHPKIDFLGSTPDALIKDGSAVVEVKNIRFAREGWGEEGTADVPYYILMGAHQHLCITDRATCYIAVLFSGQDYREFIVPRDSEMDEMIVELAAQFWKDHIEARVPPEMDGSESAKEFLKIHYPIEKAEIREATAEEIELLSALQRQKAEYATSEEAVKRLENQIKNSIGDATGITWDGGKCTWKKTKDSQKTDWKGVAMALDPSEELVLEHTETKEGIRRFLCTFKNGDK